MTCCLHMQCLLSCIAAAKSLVQSCSCMLAKPEHAELRSHSACSQLAAIRPAQILPTASVCTASAPSGDWFCLLFIVILIFVAIPRFHAIQCIFTTRDPVPQRVHVHWPSSFTLLHTRTQTAMGMLSVAVAMCNSTTACASVRCWRTTNCYANQRVLSGALSHDYQQRAMHEAHMPELGASPLS